MDLQHKRDNVYFDPKIITQKLNYHFIKRNLDLRIQETLAVHPEFRARKDTCGRSYVYQIVTTKLNLENSYHGKKANKKFMRNYLRGNLLPIHLSNTYHQVQHEHFNLEQFQDTLSLFEGKHNFRSFCNVNGWVKYIKDKETGEISQEDLKDEDFIRHMSSITVKQVESPLPKSEFNDQFNFYHVIVKGNAFLHNQIRRMVGISLDVCKGCVQKSEVQKILEDPWSGFPARARPAPPNGLSLLDVHYTEESLDSATLNYEDLPVPVQQHNQKSDHVE